jgi:hypothetical protein
MPEPPIRRRLSRHHDKYVLLGAIANEFADRIEDDEIALEQHGHNRSTITVVCSDGDRGRRPQR